MYKTSLRNQQQTVPNSTYGVHAPKLLPPGYPCFQLPPSFVNNMTLSRLYQMGHLLTGNTIHQVIQRSPVKAASLKLVIIKYVTHLSLIINISLSNCMSNCFYSVE